MDVRPSTAARDLSYTENHIKPAFGNLRLDSIDQTDVREWVARLCRRGLAPATVQKAYQILAQIMGAAVDAKVIRVSPCYNVPLPKVEREEMRFLNPGEIDRLVFALAEPRDQALVLLGCYGGLRIGELAGLNRQHVELDKGRVRVAQAAVEVRGHVSLQPPKTKAGRRTIPLPRTVVESLRYVLAKHAAPEPEAPLFATFGTTKNQVHKGERLRPNNWRRTTWVPAVKAAGLDPLRIHDMRHTAVALWIATGAPALQVSRRAGHSSVSFTLDRYGHLYEEADDALTARLERFLAGSKPVAVGDEYGQVIRLQSRRSTPGHNDRVHL
ncbi:MAG: site-specific integrase [Chloroflexota bacterium]|nr:site-specific integrase [Chloroflexota bacterium]